jgi:hypothetical protein
VERGNSMSAAAKRPTLSGAAAESERGQGFRAVGVMAAKLARPLIAKRGGVLVRLRADWAVVVGHGWADAAWPDALGRDGALKLRTVAATALELQHRAPLLIERINLYFGRPVVSRLVFVQGLTWPQALPQGAAPSVFALDEGVPDRPLGVIADPMLRAALGRLGRAVRTSGLNSRGRS